MTRPELDPNLKNYVTGLACSCGVHSCVEPRLLEQSHDAGLGDSPGRETVPVETPERSAESQVY